jgi:hypothetical protein
MYCILKKTIVNIIKQLYRGGKISGPEIFDEIKRKRTVVQQIQTNYNLYP